GGRGGGAEQARTGRRKGPLRRLAERRQGKAPPSHASGVAADAGARCGAKRISRAKRSALPTVSSAAVRNAAPGKYTPAERAEKWPNTWVMSGGPMIELRL